jgi:predicted AAA+ superfamily ATPase
MIRETDRQMKETDRRMEKMRVETDRRMEKMRVEADRRIKETDRQLKKLGIETDRRIGNLGNSLGDVIEHLMSPKLHKKFKNLGFIFDRSSRDVEIRDRNHQDLAEIDVFLENGDYAMAVEVKTRLTIPDIKEHLERMEILRQAADERKDQRKYLGAVAGASVNQNVLAYALKNGLYVIIPSGETVDIEAPGAAGPQIW